MHLLRAHQFDPTVNPTVDRADSCRFRQRHTEHIVAMMREDITMRVIRRHRLDDPRLTDETRSVLVQAVMERRKTARPSRRNHLATLIKLASFGPAALTDRQGSAESLQAPSQAAQVVTHPQDLQQTIQSIQKLVSDHFYLPEMRDPELKVRSNRRAYVLPRQIAMYLVRQLTGASLQKIGQQFGGRHHTTVLHSINKIERMRRSDDALNMILAPLRDGSLDTYNCGGIASAPDR
jgi:chromosomal replication initiation ATPase DnaA